MNHFDYFSDIEATFIRRRGRNLFLSPLDWELMQKWQTRGIPLHIVLRSINTVFDIFDKQPFGTRPINSLSYCKHEVEAAYAEYLAARVGNSPVSESPPNKGDVATTSADGVVLSPAVVERHITDAIASLNAVTRPQLAGAVQAAVSRLCGIRSTLSDDYEAIDNALLAVEKDLEFAMLTSWEPSEFEPAETEITAQMSAYAATMTDEAYQNTHSLMLLKRLREIGGIPRLGLFHL